MTRKRRDIPSASDLPEYAGEAEPAKTLPTTSTARRNREWEKRNPITGYRIPPELAAEIKRIATSGRRPVVVSDVARLFLEYGLAAYKRGELRLEPVMEASKYTLFPKEE